MPAPEAFALSTSPFFFIYMIACNARKLNTALQPPFFSYSGAGWSRAAFHRQVEVCAFHHNLSLFVFIVFILFYLRGGKHKKGRGAGFNFLQPRLQWGAIFRGRIIVSKNWMYP